MSRNSYIRLLEGFCALTGARQPDLILRDGVIAVGDVVFSLIHGEQDDAASLYIYADFGKLPSARELEVCLGLMEANLFLYSGTGPVFGISPQTRNVTLAERRQLDELTPEGLRNMLLDLASKAQEWRKNAFLELKPSVPRSARPAFLR